MVSKIKTLAEAVSLKHDKRRFPELVDYITSPGWKCKKFPENTIVFREELGLWGGPDAVISTLGVMRFHPKTHEMYAESFFADLGATPEKIASNTGFEIDVAKAQPCPPPTYRELDLLRNKIDKEGFFIPRR